MSISIFFNIRTHLKMYDFQIDGCHLKFFDDFRAAETYNNPEDFSEWSAQQFLKTWR